MMSCVASHSVTGNIFDKTNVPVVTMYFIVVFIVASIGDDTGNGITLNLFL